MTQHENLAAAAEAAAAAAAAAAARSRTMTHPENITSSSRHFLAIILLQPIPRSSCPIFHFLLPLIKPPSSNRLLLLLPTRVGRLPLISNVLLLLPSQQNPCCCPPASTACPCRQCCASQRCCCCCSPPFRSFAITSVPPLPSFCLAPICCSPSPRASCPFLLLLLLLTLPPPSHLLLLLLPARVHRLPLPSVLPCRLSFTSLSRFNELHSAFWCSNGHCHSAF